jgi:hypothetical protein
MKKLAYELGVKAASLEKNAILNKLLKYVPQAIKDIPSSAMGVLDSSRAIAPKMKEMGGFTNYLQKAKDPLFQHILPDDAAKYHAWTQNMENLGKGIGTLGLYGAAGKGIYDAVRPQTRGEKIDQFINARGF